MTHAHNASGHHAGTRDASHNGKPRVLMFGWEFPPFKSGGLGTACYDLTKGLARRGVPVTFIMPFAPENAKAQFVKLMGTEKWVRTLKNRLTIRQVSTILEPYHTAEQYHDALTTFTSATTISGRAGNSKDIYGRNILQEVERYAAVAGDIAEEEPHDVIHCHDWMTYKAGIRARKHSKKPLVMHIHATEFDRTGGNPNHEIAHREYEGLAAADLVIANSNWTKQNVIHDYKIPASKIAVVHWGIEENKPEYEEGYQSVINKDEKVVLFCGRITIQKGPDYFVEMAKKVLDHEEDVRFIVVGNGDMMPRMIQRVAELGMAHKFNFTGFLSGPEINKVYQMADVFVMPSVSEPFGLVALEAMKNGTPVLLSKQSGAAEVINNALVTDFWDVDEMANKIVNLVRHPALQHELEQNTVKEALKFNLDEPARKVEDCYKNAISKGVN